MKDNDAFRLEAAKEKVKRAKAELAEVKAEVGGFFRKYGWYVLGVVVVAAVVAGVAGYGS